MIIKQTWASIATCQLLRRRRESQPTRRWDFLAGTLRLRTSNRFPNIGSAITNQKQAWTIYSELFTLLLQSLLSLATVSSFGCLPGKKILRKHFWWCFNGRNLIASAKSLRTPSNVFVVNLAICDFIMMVKTPIFIYNSFNRGFALGIMGCKIFGILGTVSLSQVTENNPQFQLIFFQLSGIGAGLTNVRMLQSFSNEKKTKFWTFSGFYSVRQIQHNCEAFRRKAFHDQSSCDGFLCVALYVSELLCDFDFNFLISS